MMYSDLHADMHMKKPLKDSVEHSALVVWSVIALY